MMRLAALIVLQALWTGTAWSQQPVRPSVDEEYKKQESIYQSRGSNVPGGYITSRSLAGYGELLPSGFSAALKRLGPGDRWLDIGAGGGQAILDYHAPEYRTASDGKRSQPGGKAQAVAISIEDRRTEAWGKRAAEIGADRISYLFGRRLREYSSEELGKFRLITDVYGGFSYTEQLSRFVEKVLGVLQVNGNFFTMVQSVRLQDGKDNPRTWYLTKLVDARGRDVKVCSWMKKISCVKVTCESKSTWETPTELIRIRKVCENVRVPQLNLVKYEAGQPPERTFQLAP